VFFAIPSRLAPGSSHHFPHQKTNERKEESQDYFCFCEARERRKEENKGATHKSPSPNISTFLFSRKPKETLRKGKTQENSRSRRCLLQRVKTNGGSRGKWRNKESETENERKRENWILVGAILSFLFFLPVKNSTKSTKTVQQVPRKFEFVIQAETKREREEERDHTHFRD